ncbi:exodeoxyribonuclease VII large subunit [Loktanella sp. SALINAS62]|uniref:exodeoxyribonuclease VII large subunit n=1 Tax=Loktanella sp. SALINAS62 TaxID=2706124 RepID=UPI001B8ABAC5|nr:exodeoxyribonuclease VII large subunit [Loktanella sp. SALINAS62]MBS1303009.1 exodeoxyribonuclease VII large subunit [Loktanella sp. SALINAS62]
MDLFEDDTDDTSGPGDNTPAFSVSDLSGAIKKTIEGEFGRVRVRGEVGRVSRPRSGHLYLDLKDDRSVLSGIIWKGRAATLAQQPEEGMEVIATGKLTTFPGQSKYQMIIEDIAPAGAGALMAMLEKRKAALQAEGLFDAARKRPLPFLPEVIGVVTSPSGAVIRDILHRLRDRFPRKVLVWPVAVQGARCAPDVVAAIRGFNAMTPGGALPRPDLLIVARGGGSIEDLWGFNEEIVARAAADSAIPLISAVGHETDTTLIDFVSDRRAPTPTAAAEMAVPVRLELKAGLDQMGARISRALTTGLAQRDQRLRDLGRALPQAESLLQGPRQRLDYLGERLPGALKSAAGRKRVQLADAALRPALLTRAIGEQRRRLVVLAARLDPALQRRVADARQTVARQRLVAPDTNRAKDRLAVVLQRLSDRATRDIERRRARLDAMDRVRESVGYKETLRRGYAVVRGDGAVVTRTDGVTTARSIEIEFADGRITVNGDPQGKLF